MYSILQRDFCDERAGLLTDCFLLLGLVTYHTYLEVLGKRGKYREAEQVFLTMERVGCLPITNTYTLMINIYGRVSHTLLPMLICILSVKTLL
jgi:pentatricopeptide repeat protein